MVAYRLRQKRRDPIPKWAKLGLPLAGLGVVVLVWFVGWRGCGHGATRVAGGTVSGKAPTFGGSEFDDAGAAKPGAVDAQKPAANRREREARESEDAGAAKPARAGTEGEDAEPSISEAGSEFRDEVRKLPAAKPKVTPRKRRESDVGSELDDSAAARPADAAQLPPLPQDPAQWKDMDFLVARLTGDPRLLLAVDARAKRSPSSEAEVAFYRKLLAPHLAPELKDFSLGQRPLGTRGPDATRLLAAILVALAENPTPAARQALADLLAGSLPADDDAAAVSAALQALAGNPRPENEDLLLAALTDPQKVRPLGQGTVTSQSLQREALAVIEQAGSSRLRLRAAQRFLDPACPQDLRKLLASLVEQQHPENLEADALVYQSSRVDARTKALVEKQLLQYSQQAMEYFLGIAGDGAGVDAAQGAFNTGSELDSERPGRVVRLPPANAMIAARQDADPEWAYRVARAVWSGGVPTALEDRQTAMTSLDQAPNAVLLAGTIPSSESRARLARTLTRHWAQGPAPLESAGWTKTVLSEPAMFAVLKTARRSQSSPGRGGAKRSAASGRVAAGRSDPQDPGDASKRAEDPWLRSEEALLRGLCQRFLTAALAQARTRRAGGDAETAVPPPVALHSPASVVAAYQVQWPGVYGEKLAKLALDPMDVSYVRIEERARLRIVQAHYERNLKPHQLHLLAGGVRIEALQVAAKDGRTRSIDVLVTRANPKPDRALDEPEHLTVEILTVAIPALEAGPGAGRRVEAEPLPDGLP